MRLPLLAIVLAVGSFEAGRFGGLHWFASLLYCGCIAAVLASVVSGRPLTATLVIKIDRDEALLGVAFALAISAFVLRPEPDAHWIGNIAFWMTLSAVVVAIVRNRRESSDVQ